MGIGLKKGTVQLLPHDPEWAELFKQEKKLLLQHFPHIQEISHGGSTAIPGIPAKPIIDMFAAISSLEQAEILKSDLEKLGYEYRGKEGVPERILYVKGNAEKRTHHLHFVEKTSQEWKNHLLMRNYFLQHSDAAQEYAQLKQKLAAEFPNDRESYRQGKDKFMKQIIGKAKNI